MIEENPMYTKRFQLKLDRDSETPLNSWEISNFINQLTSYYYKNELINAISHALNNNISAENIFILSESFSLNKTYEKIDILNIPDDLLQLYYIGDPISLFPNRELFTLNLLFNMVRTINKTLYNNKPRLRLHNNIMIEIFKSYDQDFKNVTKFIFLQTKDLLYKVPHKTIQDKNLCETKLNQISKIISGYLNTFNDYESNKININSLTEYLMSDSDIKIESKNFEVLKNKYFNKFLYYFSKVSRPVVGIHLEEERKIKIIGKSHINKKIQDELFFDTKSITHNSPLSALFEAGLGLGQLSIEQERLKLEKEKHEWERKKTNIELQTLELEKLNKQLEVQSKMELLLKKEGLDQIQNITNPYIKQNLIDTRKRIFEGYTTLVNKNELIVNREETKIIDVSI
ncbi:hypothetical protein [Alkalicoccobacillus murimartini]|uniref:Uncharacterized protein n=1 Tax=Alkalicoccobacillus murimartini TaxID=171685 RepID=A0ABT9YMJ4_9BACI|nr:hypothetical protein [Alkalicoccobacillus murimartini]MDQ0209089.1 hypothetical protein [Alkalicoccobacillus murimartini]